MDKLLTLYQALQAEGVSLFTWHLDGEKAATIERGGQYAIFMDFDSIASRAEELVVLAHEGGHAATGATHALYSPFDLIAKHEYRAYAWASSSSRRTSWMPRLRRGIVNSGSWPSV